MLCIIERARDFSRRSRGAQYLSSPEVLRSLMAYLIISHLCLLIGNKSVPGGFPLEQNGGVRLRDNLSMISVRCALSPEWLTYQNEETQHRELPYEQDAVYPAPVHILLTC